ncbi:glycosyltransferase [bacterium]|nr:glycosyltransferase [bacterium]
MLVDVHEDKLHSIKKTKSERCSPKVSIGMPVYNGEKYLQQALDSLLSQEYENFELIISDNASTDKTYEICQDFMKTDKRIRLYRNEQNMGGWNFERVFSLASGKYFMWAAHDDLWESTYVSKLVELLEKNPSAVLAVSEIDLIDALGNKQGMFWSQFPTSTVGKSKCERIVYSLDIVYGHLIYGIFRSKVLSKNINFFNDEWPSPLDSFGQDVIFLLKCLGQGDLVIVNEPLFNYRMGGASTKVTYGSVNDIMKHFSVMAGEMFKCFDITGLSTDEILKVQYAILESLKQSIESPYNQMLVKKIIEEPAMHVYEKGKKILCNGDVVNALVEFDKAYHICPDIPELNYARVRCLLQLGKFKEAEEKVKEVLSKCDSDSSKIFAHYNLGSMYERRGDYEKARDRFETVLVLGKDIKSLDGKVLGNAHYHLGCICQSLGESEKAEREFEKCLRLIPDHKKAKENWECLNES